jgi:hypothetical protein
MLGFSSHSGTATEPQLLLLLLLVLRQDEEPA